MKGDYTDFKTMPSAVNCPKCGERMNNLYKVAGSNGKALKTPKLDNCLCPKCHHSLSTKK